MQSSSKAGSAHGPAPLYFCATGFCEKQPIDELLCRCTARSARCSGRHLALNVCRFCVTRNDTERLTLAAISAFSWPLHHGRRTQALLSLCPVKAREAAPRSYLRRNCVDCDCFDRLRAGLVAGRSPLSRAAASPGARDFAAAISAKRKNS